MSRKGRPPGQFHFRALQTLWAISVWPLGSQPTNERLAKSLGVSGSQVKNYLKYLRDEGYVEIFATKRRLYQDGPWVNSRTFQVFMPATDLAAFAVENFVAQQ